MKVSDKAVRTAIKIAAVVFTAPATYEVAGSLYPDWSPLARLPIQIAGLVLIEGALLMGWQQLDHNDKAEPAERWLYTAITLLAYVALLYIAVIHEGWAGWVFRLTLAAVIGYSVLESGILAKLADQRRADRSVDSSRSVRREKRRQEQNTAILRYKLTGERERQLLEAEHSSLLEANLADVKLRGERLLADVKREDKAERRKVAQQDVELSETNTYPYPVDTARRRATEQRELSKDESIERVISTLSNNPDVTKTELAEQADRARNTLYSYLDELLDRGVIVEADTVSGYRVAGVQLASNGNGHK